MNVFKLFLVLCLFSLKTLAATIFINQVGYLTNQHKYFYNPESADSFYVIEKSTGNVYFSGELSLSVADDPAVGMDLYRGDFSELNRIGIYFIKLKNGDSSFTFQVSSDVFREATDKSLKGFYFQRCGMELTSAFAGVYKHAACHIGDGYFHSSIGETGFLENRGGWHDAGDFGKYVVNACISVGTMLMAYEYFPDKFSLDSLNIPESGNGVPDILDEIRFELEWLLKMQKSDGGIYFKLTRENFAGFVMPQADNATRYIYQVSSTATGDFAAIMARASRLYNKFNPDFANKCLSAATLAWEFLSANTGIVPTGGFHNPSGTYTGEYGDGIDNDERLWAASELFETTGDSVYNSYFASNYSIGGVINSTMWWGNVKDLALLTYLLSTQQSILENVRNNISGSLISYCNALVNKSVANGFGVTLNPGEYTWGCNSAVLNNAILLIIGYQQSNDKDFYEAALMQLNYILGVNGNNKCFVTGLGSNPVMNPHHRASSSDGIVDPVPGLMAGGPDRYLDDDVLRSHFNNSTPPALCYVDITGSYASNEIAINWNAPLVFVSGYFAPAGVTDVKSHRQGKLPVKNKLFQNFPNPFNPSTTIGFSLPKESMVSLGVYDITGELITKLVNKYEPAGDYEVEFKADNLPSGIYLYKFQADDYKETKKMILLK